MPGKLSVAEARRNLPGLIREAERGKAVELTRRGEPVAVLIGHRMLTRLPAGRCNFADAYREFTQHVDLAEVGLDPDALFRRRAGLDAGTRCGTLGLSGPS